MKAPKAETRWARLACVACDFETVTSQAPGMGRKTASETHRRTRPACGGTVEWDRFLSPEEAAMLRERIMQQRKASGHYRHPQRARHAHSREEVPTHG